MKQLRVAVVDDDWYKREHMRQELDRSPNIEVVHAIDQDMAKTWTGDDWGNIDCCIVDVFDDAAPLEVGTDLFSGIGAIERLHALRIRTIAITPHRHHPLVEHRIVQSGASSLHRRWEFNDLNQLEYVLLNPDPKRAPVEVPRKILRRYGADFTRANHAVAAYENSELYGRLQEDATHRSVKVPRRTLEAFTESIRSTGFYAPPPKGAPEVRRDAKWAHVRDYLLILLGRKDAPPSSADEHAALWTDET